MPPRHHVSAAAIALIKRFEGYRRTAAQVPDGRWTIGYGHTRSARGGAQVGEGDAEALLLYDLGEVSIALNALIFTPLTQNQFDALASFAMNIGVDEFRRSAVLLRLNEGALLQAASAIELWRKADFEGERIVVDALVRRRAAEKALFLTPADGYVPTPTPVVRPRIDPVAGEEALVAAAVELTASLEGDVVTVRRESPADTAVRTSPTQISPTQAAAESVGARLTAILEALDLAEAPFRAEPAPVAPQAEVVQPEPAAPIAPPIVLPLPDPSSHARRMAESAPAEAPAIDQSADEAFGQDDRVEPFGVASFDASRIERSPSSYLPLALMLLVGVTLLAVATFWFVAAHPRMGGITPSVIGWALGLAGIGLLAGSIYILLERIGGRGDEG